MCWLAPFCVPTRHSTPLSPRARRSRWFVSAGPAKVRVPPVEGLTEAAARNQLTQRGLLANVVSVPVATGSVQDGIVISQSIPSTELVVPGTTIRLQVGKAAAPTTTVAPTTIAPTTVPPTADLSITKTDGVPSRSPGTFSYTIVVSNAGPFDVHGAKVNDTMPSELNNVTWTCDANCPGSVNGNINNFSIDIPSGSSVTFTVTATVTATSGTLSNTASVSVPNGVTDPTTSNNSATDTDTLTP